MPHLEEIQDFEFIAKIKECSQTMQMTGVLEIEDVQEQKNAKEDDIEQEKNKMTLRKKKNGSEDPEDSNVGHRIVIFDDMVWFF